MPCLLILDHLKLGFSCIGDCGGPVMPPGKCSALGTLYPMPLWDRTARSTARAFPANMARSECVLFYKIAAPRAKSDGASAQARPVPLGPKTLVASIPPPETSSLQVRPSQTLCVDAPQEDARQRANPFGQSKRQTMNRKAAYFDQREGSAAAP